ncbi:cation:proton antiporter [Oerskovia sp. M15]
MAIGFVVGKANLWLRSRVHEATSNTAISFVVPFIAFLPAEHLGASGLVAVVTAGIVTGLGAPKHLSPQDRIAEKANWKTVELLLESGSSSSWGSRCSGSSRRSGRARQPVDGGGPRAHGGCRRDRPAVRVRGDAAVAHEAFQPS